MRQLISFAMLVLLAGNATAANLIYYKNKTAGKTHFCVINAKQISSLEFEEKEKRLKATYMEGNVIRYKYFIVKSNDEAFDIIKKVLNQDNHSLIEVEED